MKEIVILYEPDGASFKVRPAILTQPVSEILERCHLSADHQWTRVWRCTNGERADTGQRIFREVVAAPAADAPEQPAFDEMVVKTPLRFFGDETPNGFRRKWLREK